MGFKVGLIGPNGSGKSTICDWFKKQGFTVISLSDFVRYEAKKTGLPLDRDLLIQTANRLKANNGTSFLAEKAYLGVTDAENVVFDSIRHPDEVLFLQEKGIIMIGVDASVETRYSRIISRSKDTDQVSFETFNTQDRLERSGSSSGQSITHCMQLCEHTFNNSGSAEDLYHELTQYFNTHYAKEMPPSCRA